MERLTAEDQLMLWPDEIWPQDIGAFAVLDGGSLIEPDGRFRIEAVRQAVEARLHLVPRFRQLLYVPRQGMGRPLWVDAPAFHLTDHVRVAPLPAGGDEAALLRAAEHVRRRRLDRSRPLWEMWFLPGLTEGRVGLFVRMHHAIADGIAGVATIATFLDATADAPAPPARPWTPAPAPTPREILADNLRRYVDALSTLTRPVATVRRVRAAWPAMRGQMIVPLPLGTSDPGRRLRQIAAETAERKARAHPPLGTVLRSRTARRALLKILERHPVSVTTADLPGPQQPVYLAGARLLEAFPVLPLIAKVSLGVGALSYAGQFNITAVADRDACPDLDVFAASARDELRALATSTYLVS